jgi:hypothetical protein
MTPSGTVKEPSYADILRDILSSVEGPVSTDELAEMILQKRTSHAKDPHRAAIAKIREENGRQLVYLDAAHVLPLRLAFKEARYRLRLTREDTDLAALSIPTCFSYYLPWSFDSEDITFIDSQGDPIPFKVKEISRPMTDIFGKKGKYHASVVVLREWFHTLKINDKDHILVTIENWERGVVRLEHQRESNVPDDLILERNHSLADAFYGLLESEKYEDVSVSIALPTVYARMPDKPGCPPDHWLVILANDQRMETEGFTIRYADSGFNLLEKMVAEAAGQSLIETGQAYSEEEGKQVYRLRGELVYRPSIWRDVEIQGAQTLEDLDNILRHAFQHDTSDHLSGFWKRVVRSGGPRKRYREVDLGTVNPFEPTEESDTAIAALKLKVGDQLKYVYDFGDWVEHTLELKSIGAAEKGVQYPREVARNKRQNKYCVECQENGKKTVAAWVCVSCSNEEQREITLCDECAEEHEDHYVEEILY